MNIGKIDKQVLKIIDTARTIRKVEPQAKEYKYMKEACYKFSEITGFPLTEVQNLTRGATLDQFTFLRTMINKFNYKKLHSIQDQSDHIFNIYSMVEKPTATHLNIVRKNNDSFESLEKIFALAKDADALQYVENLQYDELKYSNNASKIIVDLLTSKNKDRFIANPERYSSYLKLNANNNDAVKNLDNLIETGKYNRLTYDAKLAVQKLFKKQRIEVAMAGKTDDLEKMYTKDRAKFLKLLVKDFIPARKAPKEETKNVVVDMYGSLNEENAKLRSAIVERFKYTPLNNKQAEIVEMQKLFDTIDNDEYARTFVKKAITKDLSVGSIAELNEVIAATPLKKANIFFNNAKRIIERSTGEERKIALTSELENPFFEPKTPKQSKARMVKMFDYGVQKDDWFTRAYKTIENKINQYRFYRMSA